MSTFRFIISCTAIMLIASCTNHTSNGTTDKQDTGMKITEPLSVPKHQHTRNQLTDSMLAQIIRYYNNEYGSDSVHMELSSSDTAAEILFTATTSSPDDYQGTLFAAYISRTTDNNPITEGDMNGDQKADILFTVHTEGGGGGGNVWWGDHFLFLSEADTSYKLAAVASDADITNGSGYFFAKDITNQTINGIGNAYAETDAHCCPSLYFNIQVKFINRKLTTTNQTPIAKPADFE